jgi:hypothetical protein
MMEMLNSIRLRLRFAERPNRLQTQILITEDRCGKYPDQFVLLAASNH